MALSDTPRRDARSGASRDRAAMSGQFGTRMNKLFRLTPSRLALAYIALSVLALAMLAIPLWYAWRSNVATFKAYVDGEMLQSLVEVFDRKGAQGLAAAMESGAIGRTGDEIVVLADASKQRLAGNLPGWPAEVPAAPGTYGLVIGLDGGSSMRVVVTHVTLPGGYHLLVGRESVRFQSLVELFWYGIAGATVIVLVLGALAGWVMRRALLSEVQDISRTAFAITEGDISRRVPAGGGSNELDILARTVNGMLDQLARQNEQLANEVAVRRQAEQALHRVHDELEGLVAQRTAQLAQANESLECALREMQGQKAQFDDLFELSPDAIVLTTLNNPRNLRISKEFTRMFGYTSEEAVGKRLRHLIAPDELEPTNLTQDTDLLAGRTVEREVIRQRKDGTRFHAHITAKRVRLPDTDEDAAYIIYRDITERKRAEEALRLSEERYARAMDATEAGHWEWDLRTNEVFHSGRFRELHGVPLAERFTHRDEWKARQNYLPGERERQDAAIRGAISGPENRYEIDVRVAPRPGEIRWLRSRGKLFRDEHGRPVLMAGTSMDVTEQKLAQEALRQSEERFSAMFRGSPAPLALHTLPDGRFVDVNPAWLELFGYSRDQVIGRTSEELGLYEDPSVRRQVYEMLERDGYLDRMETALRGADGRLRLCLVSARHVEIGSERLSVTGLIDVTEAKQTALTLAESEARFRSLTELSSDFFWETDAEYRYTSIEYGKAYRGYAPTASKLGWKRWEIPHASPDGAAWSAHRAVIAARERFVDFNFSRIENGEERFYESSGEPRFDAQGRFIGYRGVGRDVTERRKVEKSLKESERRFRQLFENSADALFVHDERGHIVDCNAAACRALGYAREELLCLSVADIAARLLSEEQRSEREGQTLWQRAMAAEPGHIVGFEENELRRKDGTVFPVEVGVGAIEYEGRRLIYASARETTERKEAEAELRSRQEMLDLAQKAARALAFEWRIGASDGENRWSPDLEAMYGLPPGSYDGTFEAWKKLVHPQDWPAVKDAIRRAAETGDVDAEYRAVHPDGSVRWLQAKGRIMSDGSGQPSRIVGFMLDVTERRQAEEELRRLERQLRRVQRLEAMGTLAGGIAHDFNNILGAILGYGEMALRDAPKGSRLRRDLESILTAGERGRALVDRVLTFSRSGVGERISVHVEKVVREALELLCPTLPERIVVEARLEAGRAAMMGEPTQVHQLLTNLAANAIQAMPSGGTLRVSLEAQSISAKRVATIGTIAAAEYVVLEVADSGTGIAPEILDRIFDPFFTTKEVNVGTGLGLSLVHGIVTDVGGAIDVASTVGSGSVFTVYLPRAGDAPESTEDAENALPLGSGQRVLLVDDEEPLVRLATETLDELGYAPVGFTSSVAALDAFRADPAGFDAIITDERMPGLSGSALIREIRRIRGSIPILLVSGYVGGIVASRAYNEGADEVLKKPLSAEVLATTLARALNR